MTLPEGWAEATVDDLGEYLNGMAFKPTDWVEDGIGIIRIQNLTNPSKALNKTKRAFDERYRVRRGDLLVSWSATLDAFIWDREDALLNQHIFKVTPSECVDRDFLFYVLREMIAEMAASEHLHGSTMKHINRGPFLAHSAALPPLAEQRRIVAKLNALTARLARARAELDRVPSLAQHLRQTAITSAFVGWPRQRLGDLCLSISYGYTASAQPHGPGSKFLRITDIQNGRVDWASVPFVAPATKDLERCRLRTGDIVFARSGATVGKSFLVCDPPADAVFASYLIRVRVDERHLAPRVAAFYFQSDEYWKQIAAGATGTGQPNFNGSKLSELLVPVGSPDDQQRAVASAEAAFARADRLEAEAARARALLDRLEAAILARAFRGELVPQDPSDEPATALLARIRAQRAAAPKTKRGRKTREMADA